MLPVSGIWLLGPKLCGEEAAPHPGGCGVSTAFAQLLEENALVASWFCFASALGLCQSCPRTARDGAHRALKAEGFKGQVLPLLGVIPAATSTCPTCPDLGIPAGTGGGGAAWCLCSQCCKTSQRTWSSSHRGLPPSLSSSNAGFWPPHEMMMTPNLPQRQKRGEAKGWVGGVHFLVVGALIRARALLRGYFGFSLQMNHKT